MPIAIRPRRLAAMVSVLLLARAGAAPAQPELTYEQYRGLAWAADRLDHVAKFEPLDGEPGMMVAVAERFGTVQVYKADGRGVSRVWKSIRLSGIPDEVLAADLSGDGFDDALICRTSGGKVYVWKLEDWSLVWESLPGEYQAISCLTTANVDEDPATEIVMVADRKIYYVDGVNFTREFTSIRDYDATMVRCGDVDGDGRVEIVLNSGQVIDSVSGDVEWEDQQFYSRIELLDIDGDGMPEILTENEIGGPLKVFDGDYRSEVRFQ
ncbi:MAG TPA: hypothetical protein PLQ13_10530 [Candidatus Krumholzibacteria bacterium]|nr:hypothetical protein [Candidatus Krumholzibacteria bacterium]